MNDAVRISEFPDGMVRWWDHKLHLKPGADLVTTVRDLLAEMPEGYVPAMVHLQGYLVLPAGKKTE